MTLAARLLLLIALALAPPLAFGILNDVTQRTERAAALHRTALAESRSLQDSLSLVADGVHRLLVSLAESPPVRSGDTAACSTYLKAVSGQLTEYSLLGVADRTGRILCNDAGSAPGSYSVANRAYFQRAMKTGKFSSGDLVTGIETRRRSLHFAMPFRDDGGAVAGIVLASINQDWLGAQLATTTVPAGAEILMFDPSGTIIAAAENGAPVSADWVGQPASPVLRDALAVSKPQVAEVDGPDGKLRLFGAVPPNAALAGNTAVVGLDRERAFTDLRAASLRNLLGLLIGGIVAVVVGVLSARRFILSPLARLSAAADRVGAGDLQARADLGRRSGEIRELGAVFDRMADALAMREQERSTAESALRRNEARLHFALEAGRLGAFEWDLTADAVRPSDIVREMFGFGPNEGFASADYFGRIVPEHVDRARAETEAGMAEGRVVVSYCIRRGGDRRHIVVQAETFSDAAGNPLLIGLFSDETDRFENIAALSESEARFEAIVNCIDQMVWSTRPDGYHDYFNQRWYDFTGTEPGETNGHSWVGIFHPDDRDETDRIWRESLATGQPYYREYRLRHVSGRFRWVLGRAQPIRDEQGRIVRWYGTCTDIDEIVQAREVLARSRDALTREIAARTAELMAAEEQLRQSQKMEAVGQLTGGIAHDFNNMLQAIGGALELLVRRVDQDKLDEAKRFAGVARTTVDRAASLTHRLLAFARRQALSPETLHVPALVDGMAELASRTVGPAIEFSTQHGDGVWTVLCDLSQLENVLFNLCINARDAMPDGGKLTITTGNFVLSGSDAARADGAPAGDYVEIAVTDTGTGMDEATQARAFEPFFTTKPMGQGTGLGLSQVYGFVRQSGGFVRLESQPGQGTTVRLHLPRHDGVGPIAADGADDGLPAGSGNRFILLVEDDATMRDSTGRHLRGLGYDVRESAIGAEALLLVGSFKGQLDLLVTNVGLAGNLNGRQLAEAARQRWPHLPVLFVTSYTGGLQEDELAPGMSVVAKPIAPEALAEHIRTMLSAAAVEA